MDACFDVSCERECFVCHYDLHLSAVGCTCSPDKFACLTHAKELCACDWSKRLFLFRYELSELSTLVDALGGKLSAVHRWGLSHLGLSLSSVVTREKTPESKLSRERTTDSRLFQEKTPESKLSRERTPESKHYPNKITSLEATDQKDKGPASHCNYGGGSKTVGSYQEIKASSLQQFSFKIQKERQHVIVDSKEPCQGSFLPKTGDGLNLKPPERCFSSQQKLIVSSQLPETSRNIGNLENSVPNRKRNISTDKNVILLDVDEHERPQALPSFKVKEEPLVENPETLARLNFVDKVTNCNSQQEQVLVTPETNASIIGESDNNLQQANEKPDTVGNQASIELNNQQKECPSLPNQCPVTPFPKKQSHCDNSTGGISNFLAPKQEVDSSITIARGQLKHVDILASVNTDDETKDGKDGTSSTHNLTDGGDSVIISPSCPPTLDRHNRMQKGPRMAKVVRRINCNVEPLEYGVVLSGKLWSTSQAIFPKGILYVIANRFTQCSSLSLFDQS